MSATERTLTSDEKHVYEVLQSQRFLKMEGLSKEVPFFIYHYPPAWALGVDEMRDRLTNKLRSDDGLSVVEVNLYDLAIRLLEERGVWQRVLSLEPEMDKFEFREMLQGMLDPHDHLAPAIRELLAENPSEIVFLTGIGEVFPFIRTHTVLENLQSVVVGRPMLAWFPGTYEFTQAKGHQLRALNLSASDSYYRAKDILEQEA
jgi:bacteriophage exclusion system BrxB-like protein